MKAIFGKRGIMNSALLTTSQRSTHTYLIGQPGTGKSKAIESWVMQDIIAGRGVGVIDPHGDLFRNLLLHIADRREVWERVLIVDPCSEKWAVSFNPLAPIPGVPTERIALHLTDVILNLWHLNPATAPRMVWLLMHSLLALSELGLSLLEMPRLLLDQGFQEVCVSRLRNEMTRQYFLHQFPQSRGATHQWVTPVLNKIGRLLFDPDIRSLFDGGKQVNFLEVMNNKRVLLVNLPKGILGESASSLVGAFIVARIQQAALARAKARQREPFHLYLDEFQNYTTDNIEDILTESRKYALSLTLAHQYLDQLPAKIGSAVRNTAGTMISFRVGYQDAIRLSKDIFPSADFLSSTKTHMTMSQNGLLPQFRLKQQREDSNWMHLAQALTTLRQKEFWCRRRGQSYPTKHRTLFIPDPAPTKQRMTQVEELIDYAGRRFGKLKQDEVSHATHQTGFSKETPPFENGRGVPFWDD